MENSDLLLTDSQLAQLMSDLEDCLGPELTNELMSEAQSAPTGQGEPVQWSCKIIVGNAVIYALCGSTVALKCNVIYLSEMLSFMNCVAVRWS